MQARIIELILFGFLSWDFAMIVKNIYNKNSAAFL